MSQNRRRGTTGGAYNTHPDLLAGFRRGSSGKGEETGKKEEWIGANLFQGFRGIDAPSERSRHRASLSALDLGHAQSDIIVALQQQQQFNHSSSKL